MSATKPDLLGDTIIALQDRELGDLLSEIADLERLVFIGGFRHPFTLVRTMHEWEVRDERTRTYCVWSLGGGMLPNIPLPVALRRAIDAEMKGEDDEDEKASKTNDA